MPQVSATAAGEILLSWLEPRADKGYRFRAAIGNGARWGVLVTIDDNRDVKMFSANLPGVAELPGGALFAYRERSDRSAPSHPYATVIQLARSADHGRTWAPLPSPHADGATGARSFLSAFPAGSVLGLVWLDAQSQHHTHTPAANPASETDDWAGAVGLRYTSFRQDGMQAAASSFIDPITCECCPTSGAATARGPVVVYRDRVAPPGTRPQDIR